jgi:hypothetical protein
LGISSLELIFSSGFLSFSPQITANPREPTRKGEQANQNFVLREKKKQKKKEANSKDEGQATEGDPT